MKKRLAAFAGTVRRFIRFLTGFPIYGSYVPERNKLPPPPPDLSHDRDVIQFQQRASAHVGRADLRRENPQE